MHSHTHVSTHINTYMLTCSDNHSQSHTGIHVCSQIHSLLGGRSQSSSLSLMFLTALYWPFGSPQPVFKFPQAPCPQRTDTASSSLPHSFPVSPSLIATGHVHCHLSSTYSSSSVRFHLTPGYQQHPAVSR